MTVYIKICGITRPADALAAEQAGADAIGFVFHPKSPRYVSPDDVRNISRGLSPFLTRVGVFVNHSERFITETVQRCGLSAVQLSGDEPPSFLADAPFPVLRAVRVRQGGDLRSLSDYSPGSTFVLDSFSPGSYGGTGVPFDWDLIGREIDAYRIIIAGGLTPHNVGTVVGRLRPYGVDVSSGVEESPGIKDHSKIRRFVETVRQYGGITHDEIS
jgi:phosphoribosylanthranilate isomerase